jgi:hypothetical protein
MIIEVFDKELVFDDLVGHTTVNLKKYLAAPGCLHNGNSEYDVDSINIYYKGKDAGVVRLSIEYQPSTKANEAWTYQPYGAQPYNDNTAWGKNTDAPWAPAA